MKKNVETLAQEMFFELGSFELYSDAQKWQWIKPKPFEKDRNISTFLDSLQNKPHIHHDGMCSREKGIVAHYTWLTDTIHVVPTKQTNKRFYYHILFHELIHSVAHHSRLGKPDFSSISSFAIMMNIYTKHRACVELTAEICTRYLFEFFGLDYRKTNLLAAKVVQINMDDDLFYDSFKSSVPLATETLEWLGVL